MPAVRICGAPHIRTYVSGVDMWRRVPVARDSAAIVGFAATYYQMLSSNCSTASFGHSRTLWKALLERRLQIVGLPCFFSKSANGSSANSWNVFMLSRESKSSACHVPSSNCTRLPGIRIASGGHAPDRSKQKAARRRPGASCHALTRRVGRSIIGAERVQASFRRALGMGYQGACVPRGSLSALCDWDEELCDPRHRHASR